jgi:hypothetical protein
MAPNVLYIQIQRSTDGGTNYLPLELTDGTFAKLRTFTQGMPDEFVSAQTKPINFNNGDKIRVRYKLDNQNNGLQLKILGANDGWSTIFTNIQTYTADNFITSPFWSIGTYTTASNDFTVITASLGLTGLNQNQYSQVTPTASTTFGFSNITLPFTPEPGDFIRFEYDPSNVHVIYENMTTVDGNLALKVVPPVPSGSILDHFCLYRVNPNAGNQIILNIKKPEGTTGATFNRFY